MEMVWSKRSGPDGKLRLPDLASIEDGGPLRRAVDGSAVAFVNGLVLVEVYGRGSSKLPRVDLLSACRRSEIMSFCSYKVEKLQRCRIVVASGTMTWQAMRAVSYRNHAAFRSAYRRSRHSVANCWWAAEASGMFFFCSRSRGRVWMTAARSAGSSSSEMSTAGSTPSRRTRSPPSATTGRAVLSFYYQVAVLCGSNTRCSPWPAGSLGPALSRAQASRSRQGSH